MHTGYHLAQINVATLLYPLEDPHVAGFTDNISRINQLAEQQPGFVWRLQTPAGDATLLRVFPDPNMVVNMSVWESIDALYAFSYNGDHVEIFRQRRDWFSKMDTAHMALWWVRAGDIPTLDDGSARLAQLTQHGATPHAFTFKQRFTPAEMSAAQDQQARR